MVTQPIQRGAYFRVQRRPFGFQIVDRIGFHFAGILIADRAANIGPLVFCNHTGFTGCHVCCGQRGSVAASAVGPVKRAAVTGEPRRAGGQRICQIGAAEWLFLHHIAFDPEEIHSACRIGPDGHSQIQIVVRQKPGIAVVLDYQFQRSGVQIQQVNIVKPRIAVVQAHQYLVFEPVRCTNDIDPCIFKVG